MRSPLTTMGIAGGQETVGIAQMRPSAVSAGISSCGANTACRTVQTGAASAASSVKTSASGSGRTGADGRAAQSRATAAASRS